MRLQRQISYLQYHETPKKGTSWWSRAFTVF
jgi:hypothetical protein